VLWLALVLLLIAVLTGVLVKPILFLIAILAVIVLLAHLRGGGTRGTA
jgi:hypothetical protein